MADDPSQDPPLTIRVHPDDDPRDPAARRVIKTDEGDGLSWFLMTGHRRPDVVDAWHSDGTVTDWPVQHWLVAATVFRHAQIAQAREDAAVPLLDGCDAEGAAPFKETTGGA